MTERRDESEITDEDVQRQLDAYGTKTEGPIQTTTEVGVEVDTESVKTELSEVSEVDAPEPPELT